MKQTVAFVKKRHAMSADDYETWTESEASNTLNTFDGCGDARATTLIIYETDNGHLDNRHGGGKSQCVILNDLSPTLTCTHYGEPAVAYAQNNPQRREGSDGN